MTTKNKSVLFKFQDCEKSVSVGSKVFVSYANYNKGIPTGRTIEIVGKKYITIGERQSSHKLQFDFSGNATGNYSHNYKIYSSMEGYRELFRADRAERLIKRIVQDNKLNLSQSYGIITFFDQTILDKFFKELRE